MQSLVRKSFFKLTLSLGLTSLALGTFLYLDSSPIIFESEQSKTAMDEPIFNRVTWTSHPEKDIWMMQQSHAGSKSPIHQWDRIAIVVNKNAKPKIATFYQLKSGELSWDERSEKINYKAACFMCHSNGLRVIRPNINSSDVQLSLKDRARLFLWNLRIKTYGRVISMGIESKTPFKYTSQAANDPLQIKTCTLCHKEDGWFAKGTLTRQNFMSIQFMLEKGYMPPLGLSLKESEREEIRQFIKTIQ